MSAPILISQIGYRVNEAAKFVGLKPAKFLQLVDDGRMPNPMRIDHCVLWDVRELISSFDKLQIKNAGINGELTLPAEDQRLRKWEEIGHEDKP